jgi:ubiquinone/menaquinone biosynthesis C-methylase UbiE
MLDYEDIKKHWDALSAHENSYKSSWDDFYMLQKEMVEICRFFKGNESICDIGCNNGYCDFKLLSFFSGIKIVGMDFSDKLISQAQESLEKSEYKNRVEFITGNILDPSTFPDKKFDIILIKRVLINLIEEKDQIRALDNVKELLSENGRIILSEAVEENWARLNRLRKDFGLDDLKQPWHNKYLNDNVIKYIYSHFNVESDNDYSSSYYIFSRVFHPWLKKINKDNTLEYMSEINRMGSMFPNFGDYGTQRLFILTLKK